MIKIQVTSTLWVCVPSNSIAVIITISAFSSLSIVFTLTMLTVFVMKNANYPIYVLFKYNWDTLVAEFDASFCCWHRNNKCVYIIITKSRNAFDFQNKVNSSNTLHFSMFLLLNIKSICIWLYINPIIIRFQIIYHWRIQKSTIRGANSTEYNSKYINVLMYKI